MYISTLCGRLQEVARIFSGGVSSSLEQRCSYFVRRRKRVEDPWKTVVYHHYPKLGLVCDTDDHFIFAAQTGRGPRQFRSLVAAALRIVQLSQLAADAGYDFEPNHKFARDQHGIRTIIPAKHSHPTDKLPTGHYRRLMKVRFDRPAYRRRSRVETVMSMIKRRQGAHVRARTYHSQCHDLRLLVLTHNLMILVSIKVFYRAFLTPFYNQFRQSYAGILLTFAIGRRRIAAAGLGGGEREEAAIQGSVIFSYTRRTGGDQ